MYLVCDQNADSPSITADGDAATPLEYVSTIFFVIIIHYYCRYTTWQPSVLVLVDVVMPLFQANLLKTLVMVVVVVKKLVVNTLPLV